MLIDFFDFGFWLRQGREHSGKLGRTVAFIIAQGVGDLIELLFEIGLVELIAIRISSRTVRVASNMASIYTI